MNTYRYFLKKKDGELWRHFIRKLIICKCVYLRNLIHQAKESSICNFICKSAFHKSHIEKIIGIIPGFINWAKEDSDVTDYKCITWGCWRLPLKYLSQIVWYKVDQLVILSVHWMH